MAVFEGFLEKTSVYTQAMSNGNPFDLAPLDKLLEGIFFPDSLSRLGDIIATGGRFVHYTSAEVAVSIIQNKSIWMRNAMTMNDFSEVEHGLKCVREAWKSDVGTRLQRAIDAIHEGVSEAAAKQFDQWQPDMRHGTYLTCVSEHPPEEDEHGRLSMWRAYGGRSGIALVMNVEPFAATTDELKAYSSPVFYATAADFLVRMANMAAQLEQNADALRALTPDSLQANVFTALRFAALCTKHPAFKEEREWRVVYSPNLAQSPLIKPAVKAIRGIPQIVQSIPLVNDPDNGMHGADIPSLIHRVIIGPTEDVGAVYDAFCSILFEAGVENPKERVWASHIPLRQF